MAACRTVFPADRTRRAADGQRDRVHELSILVQKARLLFLEPGHRSRVPADLHLPHELVQGIARSTEASVTGTTTSAARPFAHVMVTVTGGQTRFGAC
jgi:hypothetical protein